MNNPVSFGRRRVLKAAVFFPVALATTGGRAEADPWGASKGYPSGWGPPGQAPRWEAYAEYRVGNFTGGYEAMFRHRIIDAQSMAPPLTSLDTVAHELMHGVSFDTAGLLYELAQEEGRALSRYGDWKILRKEKTFTTVAAETQTDTPIPTDWDAFIDNTFWNRTRRIRLYGPLNPDDWQRYKAGSTFPITNCFTIRGTSWLIRPIPAAGDTIYYEYRSNQIGRAHV